MKGEGTMSSPLLIDSDDDSEIEVLNELTHPSYPSTPMHDSPVDGPYGIDDPTLVAGSSSTTAAEVVEDAQYEDWGDDRQGRSPERGIKRQRSESAASRGSSSYNDGAVNHEGTHPVVRGGPSQPQESRKAKKRRRNAEKKKEQYQQRLARLQNAPNLTPQYPEGFTPLMATSMSPFDFLPAFQSPLANPAFQSQLVNPDFQYQNGFVHLEEQIGHGAWMGLNHMPHNLVAQYENPALQPQWGFNPPHLGHVDALPNMPAMVPPAVPIDPPQPPGNLDARSAVAKPLTKIGLPPDDDPNSKHGLFKIPDSALDKDRRPYIPTPACTLVLENLPKTHKNHDFVNSWARNASGTGANPAKVLIDGSAGKALVEFASAEAARTAWGSPQLGAALKGLKSHLLKGKPREDLIRAYWYRVDGVSAGVGEIEEGEIEESGEKEKERREKEREQKLRQAREAAAAGSSTSMPHAHWPTPMQSMPASTSNNGLPPRPSHLPPPQSLPHQPAPLALNGLPTSSGILEGDDMDLSSPSSAIAPHPTGGPLQFSPSLNRSAAPFVPSSRIPSQPRAMNGTPTEPSHLRRALDRSREASDSRQSLPGPSQAPSVQQPSTLPPRPSSSTEAMEKSLRERVLKSRGRAKASESTASTASPPSFPESPAIPQYAPPVLKPPSPKGPMLLSEMDDADSFIVQALGSAPASAAARPPAPPRTTSAAQIKAELAAKEQALKQEIKMLTDRQATTNGEKDALLRGRDRAPKEEEASTTVKPSSKINLDYVPWSNHQPRTIFDISDEEEDEEDDGEDL
ncbi:hypothetical protein NMY22_g6676 [Coprinellus aureogranulatus]|nr:hypothetical protein NMY22_g6676 [Coprinellus aureogranulatus]